MLGLLIACMLGGRRISRAGRMLRSPSSCGYRGRASPMKCERSIGGCPTCSLTARRASGPRNSRNREAIN